MIYPSDFESKIGFSSARAILASKCNSSAGKDLVDAMAFSSDFNTVHRLLSEVEEMRALLASSASLPAPAYFDLDQSLIRIKSEGAFMEADTLHRLFLSFSSMKEVRDFYCKKEGETARPIYPFLSDIFEPLNDFPEICSLIAKSVNKFGEVKDTASDALYKVRRELQSAQGAVSRAVRRSFERAVAEGIVDKDASPAVRDGRMVIPVAAASKRAVNGIVHDYSASGKTVFIEPAEVVEISNRLRELEIEERREVVAVLLEIASYIRPHVDDILQSFQILALLDFISAKASFALDIDASMPILEKSPEIDWFHAVHPMLLLALRRQGKEVVPLTLNLNRDKRFLIVSGPNAGGKSVVLKTVGFVQYMAQCGLLPSLHDNSHMGIFSGIFVDIGDEQSIENDLSTYSSHLRNMKFFMAHAQNSSLILADEMGSGTEPMIGGALAQAILDNLAESGCFGIVTTHYQNLKTFADEKEGFVNGAMIYDRQHLRPTFQLSVGNPGSSFALEIARNIGLPKSVVEDAKSIVGSDYVNLDKYLLDIERDRRYWSNKRLNIKEKESKLNNLLEKYEDTSASLREQRSQILRDARKEAEEILSSANAKIEATIKTIRDAQAEKERTKLARKELRDFRDGLKEDEENSSQPAILRPLKHKSRNKKKAEPAKASKSPKQLTPGDYVRMNSGGLSGKILVINGKKAEVAFGGLRTFVDVDKLQPASPPKPSAASQSTGVSFTTSEESRKRQLNFKQDIDVRGMRADEALQAVSYFLDDAVQFSASRLRILHGTGHGILKTIIRDMLRKNPVVKSFADEDVRFGGAGITVVDLD